MTSRKIKILWVTNVMLPRLSKEIGAEESVLGGWLSSSFDMLSNVDEFDLGVACLSPRAKERVKKIKSNMYIFNSSVGINDLRNLIINDFKPDVIHLHGTELGHGYKVAEVARQLGIKIVVSLQGIIAEIAENYSIGLPEKVLFGKTFRNFVLRDSIHQRIVKLKKASRNEILILKYADKIIGRTKWDKSFVENSGFLDKYYFAPEVLRACFYKHQWDYNNIKNRTIYFSQGKESYKGLNIAIRALAEVKKTFPDVALYVGGEFATDGFVGWLKLTRYQKYLIKLIKDYDLVNNVVFLGRQSAEQVVENLKSANVFLLSSSIENSPNALGEAMMIGVPSISSKVGGVPSLMKDKVDGLMFESGDFQKCADHIRSIFENPENAKFLSRNAMKSARLTFPEDSSVNLLKELYFVVHSRS